MDLKEIKELIEVINSSELAYFEMKINNGYIKMDKSLTRNSIETEANEKNIVKKDNFKSLETTDVKDETKEEVVLEKIDDKDLSIITSPMVGSFYSSPAPGKESFVKVGDKVEKGKVICIVEAMKLMNEIECEYNCEIVEVLINDGEMVEYSQPIFKVRRV
ncbi:acetyl-CoA carboxylase biotin carboxyl carrier protein [Clostridium carnis]